MNAAKLLKLVRAAIGGTEVVGNAYSRLRKKLPAPWKFWQNADARWAVFSISSERISEVDVAGAAEAQAANIRALFVTDSYDGVKGVAKCYRQVQPYVICMCGGTVRLFNSPRFPAKRRLRAVQGDTRIPLALLDRIIAKRALSPTHRRQLIVVRTAYDNMVRGGANNDAAEEIALLNYSRGVLDEMGLEQRTIRAATMVRTIERGGLGARRDHFFHSFQNYFYGLEAVAEDPSLFDSYWDVFDAPSRPDPFDVWFLTALWHDTGYTLEKSGEYYRETIASDTYHEDARLHRQRFVDRAPVQEGLKVLSALSAHLLAPRRGVRWDASRPISKLRNVAAEMHSAFRENIDISHGALGGLQLYSDFSDDLRRLDHGRGEALRLAIQVAGCSMPFHDYFFRESVRKAHGSYRITPDRMPFAALLAYVDSLQDDRRGLFGLASIIPSLVRVTASGSGVVSADLRLDAIPDDDVFLKIVEAHDVLAALNQRASCLRFEFPGWMHF